MHERHTAPPRSTFVAPVVVAAVLLVVAVVAGALGGTTLAVLAGLGTIAALVVVVRALVYERRRRRNLQSDLEATRTSLDDAEVRARRAEAARQQTVDETQRLTMVLRGRLSAPVGVRRAVRAGGPAHRPRTPGSG